ncbi:MAG: hypothetical protein V7711_13200 [Pseudomonadales bacterium]
MRKYWLLSLVLALTACGTSHKKIEIVEEVDLRPKVGIVALQVQQNTPEHERLDVNLAVFDLGVSDDAELQAGRGVFPKIRAAEARYFPVLLAKEMIDTNSWGVVRVIPEVEHSAELLVTGKIIRSDGLRLELYIKAEDASGRVWLDQIYIDETEIAEYSVLAEEEPYIDLYRKIANDLLAARRSLTEAQLNNVAYVAFLRYAASLSPDAFGRHLSQSSDGTFVIERMPAKNDPMIARVNKVRNLEYQFIDTIDEQYISLYKELTPTYKLWRKFSREMLVFQEDYQQRMVDRENDSRRGTFFSMQQTYSAYKWSKIQEQDLEEMAQGFNNEAAPTVMEVRGEVRKLDGTLDSQYTEWRQILRDIFAQETGLPMATESDLDTSR